MSLPLLTTRSFVVRVFFSMRANISFIKPLVILLFFFSIISHSFDFVPTIRFTTWCFFYFIIIILLDILSADVCWFLHIPVFFHPLFSWNTFSTCVPIQVCGTFKCGKIGVPFLFHRFFVDSEIKWPIWGDKTRGFLFFQFRGLREIVLSYIFPKQKRN